MKYNFLFLLSCSPLILSRRLFQRPYKNPIQYRNFHIPSSSIQTKLWRQQQLWYKNGKHNECELYQKPLIEKITQKKLEKSNERLHTQQYDMNEVNRPMKNIDGLEWTENFDGYIFDKNKEFYFNLKLICDDGGAQTRSIRETYFFIKNQLEHVKHNYEETKNKKYFINILDGNTCHRYMKNFLYLMNKKEYTKEKAQVFVGDMDEFQNYWLNSHSFDTEM
uniref:Uncharacterized protein n=1 Tax=viral metagenome TaxID=1070528 RepID=A0A6C0F7W4_9ZZZZ|tara:strand:+ start:18135 stop:18797 length:663 start_codon:yes stop_codon:yes gene_type:complete